MGFRVHTLFVLGSMSRRRACGYVVRMGDRNMYRPIASEGLGGDCGVQAVYQAMGFVSRPTIATRFRWFRMYRRFAASA